MSTVHDLVAAAALAFGLIASALAADGANTIEVTGNIRTFTDSARRVYSLTPSMLARLPQASITTTTAWTPVATFTGVRMNDIIRVTGARGGHVQVYALDDYSVRIPNEDFHRYGVIVARTMNGQPLLRNRFGPYFIIYPKDKFPKELGTPTAEAKFVWQVHRLVFQ